ncbi:MAG TPA: MarR family transcriptional regulator [Kofleriaceae bacterium]|nr:MarR family transcriptional regulator [Kofleriaceae bacterium]
MHRIHNKRLKSLGLSTVNAHILAALWLDGPMMVGELQRVLALSSSSLTGALDRMEKSELVTRAAVPGDRRAFRVEAAAWSDARKGEVFAALAAGERDCFGALDARERATLVDLLQRVSADMERSGE